MLKIKPEQVKPLAKLMGTRLGEEFAEPWAIAVKNSKVAAEKMQEIETLTKAGKYEEAAKLKNAVYEPVRDKFWAEIYKSKKIRDLRKAGKTKEVGPHEALVEKIEAAGLKFEGGAPYLPMRDESGEIMIDRKKRERRHTVSLEHVERKSDVPLLAQDADNLVLSFNYENSQVLEAIKSVEERHKKHRGKPAEWAAGRNQRSPVE